MSRPIRVVTYWTSEAYRVMAEQLVETAQKVGLESKVYVASDLGSWKANTEQKSTYLQMAMDEFPKEDVLWMDADSQFVSAPTALLDLSPHYQAALYREHSILWGCTMFFRNGPWARQLLARWDRQVEATPRFSADSNLLYVLKKFPSTSIYSLPPAYVWHDQHMRQRFPRAKPVVLQRMYVTFENKDLRRFQVKIRKEGDWT